MKHYEDNAPAAQTKDAEPAWLDESHRRRLLCFVHIPKTAGTTFKDLLWHVYGRRFLIYHEGLSPFRPQSVTRQEAQSLLALGGHLPYGFHSMFGTWWNRFQRDGLFAGREIHYVTVVRDPVERLLSIARFARTFPAHRLYRETKNMTCAQFFEHAISNRHDSIIGNLQCDLLAAGRPSQAIDYANSRYLAVSTTKGIPAMIRALSRELDWPKVGIKHKNKSPAELTSDNDRQTARAICAQYCKLDLQLYAYVASQPDGLIWRGRQVETPAMQPR